MVTVIAPFGLAAGDPFLVVPPDDVTTQSPAYRYANMEESEAITEIDRRSILYQRTEPHGHVRTPVRLTGRLRGVHVHSALAEHERPTTPFEICDARLILALDDFADQLQKRDIVELVHYTMYRPLPHSRDVLAGEYSYGASEFSSVVSSPLNASYQHAGDRRTAEYGAKTSKNTKTSGSRPAPSATARKSAGATKLEPPRLMTGPSRHSLGLAIDVGAFVKRDGTILRVSSLFGGNLRAQTCGPRAKPPRAPNAKELWDIVCDAFDAKIFTYALTPNFDRAHHDHFHMEINPTVKWFLYH